MSKVIELIKWVSVCHKDQKRKYTGEPYVTHVKDVGHEVAPFGRLLFEVGLCHDLVEDTDETLESLEAKMLELGYDRGEARFVVSTVNELTDIYTHEDYPEMNRKERKKKEGRRMWSASWSAQTVKFADVIDNTKSICEHDPGFAKVYLEEIEYMMSGMLSGHGYLRELANTQVGINKYE